MQVATDEWVCFETIWARVSVLNADICWPTADKSNQSYFKAFKGLAVLHCDLMMNDLTHTESSSVKRRVLPQFSTASKFGKILLSLASCSGFVSPPCELAVTRFKLKYRAPRTKHDYGPVTPPTHWKGMTLSSGGLANAMSWWHHRQRRWLNTNTPNMLLTVRVWWNFAPLTDSNKKTKTLKTVYVACQHKSLNAKLMLKAQRDHALFIAISLSSEWDYYPSSFEHNKYLHLGKE